MNLFAMYQQEIKRKQEESRKARREYYQILKGVKAKPECKIYEFKRAV